MNNKFMELLKGKNYVVPSYLFMNFNNINISNK